MINLFIDTNVLLSFYHLTNEDLEELRKLAALIDSKQIKLFLTSQVKQEFDRNRGSKIEDALKKLREARFNLSFPAFCKGYEEYEALRSAMQAASKLHSELLTKVIGDAESNKLNADPVIAELFSKAEIIETTIDIYNKAIMRVRVGNPPGKDESLGDALNWQCLLSKGPNGSDLFLVSDDKDFRSKLKTDSFSEFLASEWLVAKKSRIIYYQRISEFFKENFPEIKIASEVAKDSAIKLLKESRSFAVTHAAIARLAKFNDFTIDQVEKILKCVLENKQVSSIVTDDDLRDFYSFLWLKYGQKLSPDSRHIFNMLYEELLAPELDGEDDPSDDQSNGFPGIDNNDESKN